jgi:hypothetical protein
MVSEVLRTSVIRAGIGAHGLTPTDYKYSSGEMKVTGRIPKVGDHGMRAALLEAANVILTWPVNQVEVEEVRMPFGSDGTRSARKSAAPRHRCNIRLGAAFLRMMTLLLVPASRPASRTLREFPSALRQATA